MDRIKLFSIATLLFLLSSGYSGAVVLIESADGDPQAQSNPEFSSATLQTGQGSAGNFAIITCATTAFGPNQFLDPAPGEWTSLSQEFCAGNNCIQGIWTSFLDTPDSEEITCAWTDPQNVFAGTAIRYTGVDTENPIIDIACSEGSGDTAVAPSILTETKSQVLRIFSGSAVSGNDADEAIVNNRAVENDEFGAGASVGVDLQIETQGESNLAFFSGLTGTAEHTFFETDHWVACTIGIRMQPTEPIPTMSEWGFVAIAVFMGAAGVWYLRRRQAQDA